MIKANRPNYSWFQRLNKKFILIILLLNIIGLINLYSATHGITDSSNQKLFWQQIIWSIISWVVFFIVTGIGYNFFKRMTYIIYSLNLAALVGVSFFGSSILGAKRWLNFGLFKFQPSETIKISLVLILASYLSKKSYPNGISFKELIIPILITLIPFILTVKQPDLGTSLLIAAVSLSMFLFIGIKFQVILFTLFIGFITTPLIWNFGLKSYQKQRIYTFLSPLSDPRGAGYNSIQSKIAIGSGGFIGKGFRKGTQSQLEFIPERHSDFIYSVLSEEHGFIGSLAVLALFLALLFMIIQISATASDTFAVLMVVGLGAILFWHIIINIGMVTGLVPVVGVPLPIFSKGGSSLLTTFLALGLISSVSSKKRFF